METEFIISSTLATEKNEASAAASEDVQETSAAVEDHEEHEASHEDQETQDDDQDLESQEDDTQEEKPRPKNGFKKRIDRERRKVAERDQRIAALEADLESAKKSTVQKTEANTQTSSDQEPDPNDFETVGEFNKAVIKWELKQEKLEREKLETDSKKQSDHKKLTSDYEARRSEFVKTASDFDDVVADFADKYGDFKASPAIVEALMSSELGPEVFYQVVKNHSEYERLSKLSEVAIIRELGKIEARLALEKESPTVTKPKMSKAPAPVSKVSGGVAATTKSLSDPNISFAEYEQIRMKQLKQK